MPFPPRRKTPLEPHATHGGVDSGVDSGVEKRVQIVEGAHSAAADAPVRKPLVDLDALGGDGSSAAAVVQVDQELCLQMQRFGEEIFSKLDVLLVRTEDSIVERLLGQTSERQALTPSEAQLWSQWDAAEGVSVASALAASEAAPLPQPSLREPQPTRGLTTLSMGQEDAALRASAAQKAVLAEHGGRSSRRSSKQAAPDSTDDAARPRRRNSRAEAASALAADIVRHPSFEICVAMLILSNAIFIGFQVSAQASGADRPTFFAINALYTLLFALELLLRIRGFGVRKFFLAAADRAWHYLDVVVVVAAILESFVEIFEFLGVMPEGGSFSRVSSQFRLLRIVKTTGIIRTFRVKWLLRFVRSLRMLVTQIASTAKSLVWAVILLVMVIYLFAILFTQGAISHLGDVVGDAALQHRVGRYWATVPRSMFTLFKAITGGISWVEVVDPLSDIGGEWVLLFVAYICFTEMAVMNVLIGAFCQSAIESAAVDQDLAAQSAQLKKDLYMKQISRMFGDIDVDESGEITLTELQEHLKDESVQAVFDSLGLDASDAWNFFKLVDIDRDGVIKLDEFRSGCCRLNGSARALDMALMHYEHRSVTKRLTRHMKFTEDMLDRLCVGCRDGSGTNGKA